MSKTTTTNATLQDALVFNNRFASAKLNAEQLSAESFANWTALVKVLHRECYKTYALCENNGLKAESTTVDKSNIFTAIRDILAVIGNVNGHKVYANAETAIAFISYAGKRGNTDAPELQLCNSELSNARRELAKYEELNVKDADYKAERIADLKARIADCEARRASLLETPDMRIKTPTMTNANAFRLDVEHFLARVIAEQNAKSLEQLDAEEAERKARRAARVKKNKENKSK